MLNIIYNKDNIITIKVDTINQVLFIYSYDENYYEDIFDESFEYIKNFWILAEKNNIKYSIILIADKFKIAYPTEVYNKIIKNILLTKDITKNYLIASCLVTNSKTITNLLTIFFKLYKPKKPYIVVNNLDKAYDFINNYK